MKLVCTIILILLSYYLRASKTDSLKVSQIDSLINTIDHRSTNDTTFKINKLENCDCKKVLGIFWKWNSLNYFRVIKRDSLIFLIIREKLFRNGNQDVYEKFYFENNKLILYYKAIKAQPELKYFQKIIAYFDNDKIIKLVSYNCDRNNLQDSLSNIIFEAQSEILKNKDSNFYSPVDKNNCCFKIKYREKPIIIKTRYNKAYK